MKTQWIPLSEKFCMHDKDKKKEQVCGEGKSSPKVPSRALYDGMIIIANIARSCPSIHYIISFLF